MGTRKSTAARILTLACAGLFCLGGSYTWTGSQDWDDPDNWTGGSSFPPSEFPDDSNDDALIPTLSFGNWTVKLVPTGVSPDNYVIDDLRIEGSVLIVADTNDNPILTADTVTIKGGATSDTRVRIPSDGDGAQIEASSCG